MSYASSRGNAPPVDHHNSLASDPAAHIADTPDPKTLSTVCEIPPRNNRFLPSDAPPATANRPDAPVMFHNCTSNVSKSLVTSSNFPLVFPPVAYATNFLAVVCVPYTSASVFPNRNRPNARTRCRFICTRP